VRRLGILGMCKECTRTGRTARLNVTPTQLVQDFEALSTARRQ